MTQKHDLDTASNKPVISDQLTNGRKENRRMFNRVSFKSTAQLSHNNETIPVEIIDISLKGVLIKGAILQNTYAFEMEAQIPLQLMICLSENIQINMLITLIYQKPVDEAFDESLEGRSPESLAQESIIGCRCVSIDHTSLTHLRRLIELNSSLQKTTEDRSTRSEITENNHTQNKNELAALFDDYQDFKDSN